MAISISVVIPYYNGGPFIAEALASVRAQTLAPIEIVIVDDASRPSEGEILDREASDCVVIHLPENRGPSAARNIGIDRARGEWIAFLDCDDLWDPRKLERQVDVINANPGCRAIHCGMRSVLPDGTQVINRKGEIGIEDFLVFPLAIFPSAVIMRRDTLIECGLFDPTMGVCHDLDLFLRFCSKFGKFYAVPDPLVTRRIQPGGVSRNIASFWIDAERVYREFLITFPDDRRARRALRDVHTDMALRAVYTRDFNLMWRRLRRATRRDVPLSLVLSRVAWRVLRNRFGRSRQDAQATKPAEGTS
jgi:glycosyltransferase involved in cell wall biosynthesis